MAQSDGVKKCYYCGHRLTRKNHTLDHVVPTCKGGKDKKWNKVDCCNTCNQEKGCVTTDAFRAVLAYRAADYKDKSIFWIDFYGEKK